MRIGEIVRCLREAHGWTQEYLAEKSGAYDSGAAISMVETGDRNVPAPKLVKILDALLEEEEQDLILGLLELIAQPEKHQNLGAIRDLIKVSLQNKKT